MNDFIVRATALALIDVPRANSQWDAKSGEVVPCESVDISIAVATDKGLITPIVKDANKKSLTQISTEVHDMPLPSASCVLILSAGRAHPCTYAELCSLTITTQHIWEGIVLSVDCSCGIARACILTVAAERPARQLC